MIAMFKAEHHSIVNAFRLACRRLILLFNRCRGNPIPDRPGVHIPMINFFQTATTLRHHAKALHPSPSTLACPRMHHIHRGRLTSLSPRYRLSLLHRLTGSCIPNDLVFIAKNRFVYLQHVVLVWKLSHPGNTITHNPRTFLLAVAHHRIS
jgi:hypothetical protein